MEEDKKDKIIKYKKDIVPWFWFLWVMCILACFWIYIFNNNVFYSNQSGILFLLFIAFAMLAVFGFPIIGLILLTIFSKKKEKKETRPVFLWFLATVGLFIGLYTLVSGNMVGGIFWIALGLWSCYELWRRKKGKVITDSSIASPTKNMNKKWKIIIGSIVILFVVFIIVASYQKQGQTVFQEWARITSPDGNLSIELPRNPIFNPDKTPDTVEGYSYIAYEKQDKVSYIVKYENYQAVATGMDFDFKNINEQQAQTFLKGLADTTVQEFDLSNFTSQFTVNHGHNAVKFNGEISSAGKSASVEGIIILINESAYSLITLCENGYTADFDRALNSLVIK